MVQKVQQKGQLDASKLVIIQLKQDSWSRSPIFLAKYYIIIGQTMGLTKPRASQIYNLDYKQATRVVTVTNINLTAGAPSQVDGVTLGANDRILVAGQSTASQNGLYDVSTVGSGSNGTWVRTSDANSTGEIDAGMIVMVTEGLIYADTQWKLITDNPIDIGATPLVFTQNYSANSISSGTSNVVVNSNANVTISSAGVADVLTVSSTGTVILGTLSVTGNIIAPNVAINRGAADTNWNTLINMGTYTVDYTSWSGTTGTPVDSSVYVGLLSVGTSGSITTQTFYPGTITPNNVKIQWDRTLYNGTWTAWYKILNDFQVVDAGSYQDRL